MKQWKIKAKSAVQILSIGKTLPSGAETIYVGESLPKGVEDARRQGLIRVELMDAKEKVEDKPTTLAAPAPPSVNPPEPPKKNEEKKMVKVEVKEKKEEQKEEKKEEKKEEGVIKPPPQKPIEEMYRSELDAYAKDLGLDPSKYSNKDDVRNAIEKFIEDKEE